MKIVIAILLTTSSVSMAEADEPPALSHNPFARPPSEVIRDVRGASARDEITGAELVLQATMIGDNNKLANVGGRILKPGDEIDGHVLVKVLERYAVFERDGRTITVYVKPDMAGDDD